MTSSRLTRLRHLLRETGLDGLLLTNPSSIRYLTGFTGTHALCVVTGRDALFCTDPRYREQARMEVRGWRRRTGSGSLVDMAASTGVLAGVRTVGFESSHVTYASYRHLRTHLPSLRWAPTSDLVEGLAMIKDARELALLRTAVSVSERTLLEVMEEVRPGVSELELAAEITYRHRRNGAERDAFEPLIGSGPRSSLPHPRPTGRKLRRGDWVVIDIGCTVGGYNSDITRTVSVGRPTSRLKRVHAAVLTAQQEALEALGKDVACSAVDSVARRSLEKAGLSRYFSHSLGHGLGLAVHERPRLAPRSTDLLREGNVVTVEPGVYFPGENGVRIEDDVAITGSDARPLGTLPRTLLVV